MILRRLIAVLASFPAVLKNEATVCTQWQVEPEGLADC